MAGAPERDFEQLSTELAGDLWARLEACGGGVLRLSRVRGTVSRTVLAEMSGTSDSIALVLRDGSDPVAR